MLEYAMQPNLSCLTVNVLNARLHVANQLFAMALTYQLHIIYSTFYLPI